MTEDAKSTRMEVDVWKAPETAFEGPAGRSRWGRWVGIAVVFPVSGWLGMAVNFVLFGFNPGGSVVKEAMWRTAVVLWPAAMLLLLFLAIRSAMDPRRGRDWAITLSLMGTCPVWFPIACVEFVRWVGAMPGR